MSDVTNTENGEGLIWNSTVEIEIGPQISKRNSAVTGDCESLESTCAGFTREGLFNHQPDRQVSQNELTLPPHSPGADADDEGPLRFRPCTSNEMSEPPTDVRGRPRSNTKQLRRRGIDLSRDELRISSRWSSGEKRSMENFRDAIRKKANGIEDDDENVWSWLVEKHRPILEEAKNIKDRFAKSLQRNASRGRNRKAQVHEKEDTPFQIPRMGHGQLRNGHFTSAIPLEQHHDISEHVHTDLIPLDEERSERQASWQEHLKHDLLSPTKKDRRIRHKKGHYTLRQPSQIDRVEASSIHRSHGKSLLPSDFFPDYQLRRSSSAGPLLQPSAELYHDVQEYHRLPSLSDMTDPGSNSSSGMWTLRKENLGDIFSSEGAENTWYNKGITSSIASSSSSSSPRQGSSHLSTLDLIHIAQCDNQRQFPQHSSDTYGPFLTARASDMGTRVDSGNSCNWSHQPGRLVSSMSVPDSLDSRCSSFQRQTAMSRQTRALALHSLTMRLPHENLVRPSIGAGWKE